MTETEKLESVIAHELGHAIVAIILKVKVEKMEIERIRWVGQPIKFRGHVIYSNMYDNNNLLNLIDKVICF